MSVQRETPSPQRSQADGMESLGEIYGSKRLLLLMIPHPFSPLSMSRMSKSPTLKDKVFLGKGVGEGGKY